MNMVLYVVTKDEAAGRCSVVKIVPGAAHELTAFRIPSALFAVLQAYADKNEKKPVPNPYHGKAPTP